MEILMYNSFTLFAFRILMTLPFIPALARDLQSPLSALLFVYLIQKHTDKKSTFTEMLTPRCSPYWREGESIAEKLAFSNAMIENAFEQLTAHSAFRHTGRPFTVKIKEGIHYFNIIEANVESYLQTLQLSIATLNSTSSNKEEEPLLENLNVEEEGGFNKEDLNRLFTTWFRYSDKGDRARAEIALLKAKHHNPELTLNALEKAMRNYLSTVIDPHKKTIFSMSLERFIENGVYKDHMLTKQERLNAAQVDLGVHDAPYQRPASVKEMAWESGQVESILRQSGFNEFHFMEWLKQGAPFPDLRLTYTKKGGFTFFYHGDANLIELIEGRQS